MSIFKETIPGFIQQQLKIREEILGLGIDGGGRTSEKTINTGIEGPKGLYGDITIDSHAFYTNHTNRQCVLRMSSGVDLISDDILEDNRFESWNYMKGVNMAQRYILQGGTLVSIPKGDNLAQANRKGFPGTYHNSKQRSMGFAYGDPLLRSDANEDGFGIVPMPGIIDANIRTKSAYGSLREAKVKFVCHNQRQLEILEMLYMRPGYSVLLEWGWAPYIDNYGKITKDLPQINNFFDQDATQEDIEREINRIKIETGGNYDAIIGFVKNFKYSLRGDGGFDCETELMSRGEVIESLKMNKEGIYNPELAKEEGNSGWENKDTLEIILDKIIEYGELNDKGDDWLSWIMGKQGTHQAKAKLIGASLAEILGDTVEAGENEKDLYPLVISKDSGLRNADGEVDSGNEFTSTFIRWDALATMINNRVIPQTPKGLLDDKYNDPLFKIVTSTPTNLDKPKLTKISPLFYNLKTTTLADKLPRLNNMAIDYSVLDMSLDPSVCLLPHQIYDLGEGSLNTGGALAAAGKPFKWAWNLFASDENDFENEKVGDFFNYNLPPEDENRQIGKIYFNVEHLKTSHKSLAYDSEGKANENFVFHDWLKKIWDDVNAATAGTHDFTINIDSQFNTNIRIIDLSFGKDPELELDSIYTFNIQSPNSTAREVAYNTSVPSSLSATIAVAAQAPDSIDSLDKVTWAALNKGISNRFSTVDASKIEKPDEIQQKKWKDELDAELEILYTAANINKESESQSGTLVQWRTDMLQGKGSEKDDEGVSIDKELIDEMKGALNALQNSIDRIHKKYTNNNNKDKGIYYGMTKPTPTQPRSAIIPLKFNCKLDGIGGLIIGNVFKLPKNRLPRGYDSDSVHFVVMGEEQNISGQDWTTTMNGHLILLGDGEDTGSGGDNDLFDTNSYDETKGEFYTEGSDIPANQRDIDEDMEKVAIGDMVWLKVDSVPVSCRSDAFINNEHEGVEIFDNTVGMFDKGNGGMMLGKVLDIKTQDRSEDTRSILGKIFFEDKRQIKTTETDENYFKDDELAYNSKEKKYFIKQKGEWVAIDPDTINELTVWYKIELCEEALDHFNLGWVMELQDEKTTKNNAQGDLVEVNTWTIDTTGADSWEQIMKEGDAPGAAAYYFNELQKGIKEDGILDQFGSNDIRAREHLDLSRGVWMRIDTIQASAGFTPDLAFEAATPAFVEEIDGSRSTIKEVKAIRDIEGEKYEGKGISEISEKDARSIAFKQAREEALKDAGLNKETPRLRMQEVAGEARSDVKEISRTDNKINKKYTYESEWEAMNINNPTK